jgi:hypothetical protein
MGFSAIAWKNFKTYFAGPLGYTDERMHEMLWSDLQKGIKKIPIGDIHIADERGRSSAWVTDGGKKGAALKATADPQTDVYDALALD